MKTILLLGCSGTGRTSVGRALIDLLTENSRTLESAGNLEKPVERESSREPKSLDKPQNFTANSVSGSMADSTSNSEPKKNPESQAISTSPEFVELEEFFSKQFGLSFETALELWEHEKFQQAIGQAALELLNSLEQYSVISLTPSAPKDPKIAEAIKRVSSKLLVVELRASLDVLGRRVGLNAPRPLGLVNSQLPGPYALFRQFTEDLHQVYQQFSPLVVDTSATTATQAAAQILAATR